jgi:hypothetical protein
MRLSASGWSCWDPFGEKGSDLELLFIGSIRKQNH